MWSEYYNKGVCYYLPLYIVDLRLVKASTTVLEFDVRAFRLNLSGESTHSFHKSMVISSALEPVLSLIIIKENIVGNNLCYEEYVLTFHLLKS